MENVKEFGEDEILKYIEEYGDKCPHCGSDGEREIIDTFFSDVSFEKFLRCEECGKKWSEYYKLVKIYK